MSENLEILGKKVNENTNVIDQRPDGANLARVGLSNNFIVNLLLIIILQAVYWLFFFMFKVL